MKGVNPSRSHHERAPSCKAVTTTARQAALALRSMAVASTKVTRAVPSCADYPGRGCVASAVLAGVPAKPLVELGFARAEVRAIVPLQIEGLGRSELNQAN